MGGVRVRGREEPRGHLFPALLPLPPAPFFLFLLTAPPNNEGRCTDGGVKGQRSGQCSLEQHCRATCTVNSSQSRLTKHGGGGGGSGVVEDDRCPQRRGLSLASV